MVERLIDIEQAWMSEPKMSEPWYVVALREENTRLRAEVERLIGIEQAWKNACQEAMRQSQKHDQAERDRDEALAQVESMINLVTLQNRYATTWRLGHDAQSFRTEIDLLKAQVAVLLNRYVRLQKALAAWGEGKV